MAVDLSLSLQGIVSQRLIPRLDGSGRIPAIELLPQRCGTALREQRYGDLEDLMRGSRTSHIQTFNAALLDPSAKLISQDTAKAARRTQMSFAAASRMSTGSMSHSKESDTSKRDAPHSKAASSHTR